MATYIAEYVASHKIIQVEEHSCFIWNQDPGDIDVEMLIGKIIRESSIHFYKVLVGSKYSVAIEDISVGILQTQMFTG